MIDRLDFFPINSIQSLRNPCEMLLPTNIMHHMFPYEQIVWYLSFQISEQINDVSILRNFVCVVIMEFLKWKRFRMRHLCCAGVLPNTWLFRIGLSTVINTVFKLRYIEWLILRWDLYLIATPIADSYNYLHLGTWYCTLNRLYMFCASVSTSKTLGKVLIEVFIAMSLYL